MMKAFDLVKKTLTKHKVQNSKIVPESLLAEDAGLKGKDLISFAMDLEDTAKIAIPDESIARWKTIGDVISTVDNLLPNQDVKIDVKIA
jgi:acyl carrier protein